ncbi:kynurenine 3-monooxygenase isoform X2 [Cryptomeria japonica]|uniref:kynurenine 3-monooxygenase isoform X2 n=1 Tax=Cryptomeria japonica TaxID=3369 RepID=UPI0027D9F701|nr:kynurenine 3-monooxygenase isoform X2 [Cryptomeria japonica]
MEAQVAAHFHFHSQPHRLPHASRINLFPRTHINFQFSPSPEKAKFGRGTPFRKNKFLSFWPVHMAATEAAQSQPVTKAGSFGKAVVVGGGPAGCVMALYLLRRGFHVHVFERRSMIDEARLRGDPRSFPILLTRRGIKVIEAAGLELPSSILKPQVGNCSHLPKGKKMKMDYYSGPGTQSYVASRNGLVAFLQQSLLQRVSENLTLYFGWELSSIDDKKSTAKFFCNQKYSSDSGTNDRGKVHLDEIEVEFDFLVGADGVSSKVRSEILRLDQAYGASDKSHITLDFMENPRSYKSFYVCPSLARESAFIVDHDRVQAWRNLNLLLVNVADGSFWGGTLNEELVSAPSPTDITRIFREKAPDVLDLLLRENQNFAEDLWKQAPMRGGGAVLLSQFHHRNIVVIGDAAHGMFPTYGTGCNAALEDCLIMDNILEELTPSDGRQKIPYHLATAEFTKRRILDAHAIVEMNSNFLLFPRNKLGIIQSVLLRALHKWFPKIFGPTAHQLLWTDTPYSKIRTKKHKEDIFVYSIIVVLGLLIVLGGVSILKKLIAAKSI